MLDPKTIDDLAHRLANALPPGVSAIKDEMEKNFRAVLQGAFAKLDLVTREEFEVQKAVLAKTRTKLEDLELRLAHLETPSEHDAPASADID
ncbi:MAG: accessory factor UbiK family protein [Methylococcales bacterium]|nr:accessory factor UbiK family protein [Methylococcales bacterium]